MDEPPIETPEGSEAKAEAVEASHEHAPEAVNEASVVPENVAAAVAEAPAAANLPAPPPAPVAPMPAPLPAAVEMPVGLQKPNVGRVIVDYFWGTLTGASLALSLLGLIILLHAKGVNFEEGPLLASFAGIFVAAMALGLWRGFPTPAQTAWRRIRRGVASAFVGGAEFGLLVFAFIFFEDAWNLSHAELGASMIMAGGLLMIISLVRASRARKRAKDPALATEMALALVQRQRVGAMPYALAGLAGAGILAWIMSVIFALEINDIYRVRSSNRTPVALAAIAIAVVFASWRGFPKRLRGVLSLGARIFLPLLFGFIAGLGLITILAIVDGVSSPGRRGMATLLILLSLAMIGVGLWRGREPRSETRGGRIELGLVAAILILGSLWPQSAWMRYALGSAEGARTLADEHAREGEIARAEVFYEVACDRGDADACARGASMSAGSSSSNRRARELIEAACDDFDDCRELAERQTSPGTRDMLLSRACDLGSEVACMTVTRNLLRGRCDNGDGYACSSLAATAQMNPGTPREAAELWQKACALGDRAACTHVGVR